MSHDRTCPTCRPGTVSFFRSAGDSAFVNAYLRAPAPTLEQQAWMREHYWRIRVNSPFFDPHLEWSPPALAYKDLYAIYVGQEIAQRHPEWILLDPSGEPMYLKYGSPPYAQWAGDITNPAFRAHWIATARELLARGYVGLVVDDVNFYRMVATATGAAIEPTGFAGAITDQVWRKYIAIFLIEIRAALPAAELVFNTVWYAPTPEPLDMTLGLAAATHVEIERGVNDKGLTGGEGKYALRSMLAWIDRRHMAGVSVVFDSQALDDSQREYGLACYLLTSNGEDMLGSRLGGTPDDWWPRYEIALGAPRGPRERLASGLLHRAFKGGHVYVNEPGGAPVAVGDRALGPASGLVVT